MLRKKLAAAVATGIAAVLTLAGCSGGGGDADAEAAQFDQDTTAEISFSWWGNDDRAAQFEQAIALFNEEYPNVKVTRNFASFADYWTARNTEAAGHALPDLMMMDAGYLSNYAGKGLLADLTDLRDGVMPLDGIDDAALGAGTVDDKLAAVPLGTNLWSMMYNKDLLDSFGIAYPTNDMSWDDLQDFVREVDEAGASSSPSVLGSDDYTGNLPGFIFWLMQQDKDVFDESGQPAFTQDDVVEYVDSVQDLRAADEFFPVDRNAALTPLNGFLAGQAALWFNFSTTLLQAMTDTGTENIGIVSSPTVDGDSHVLAPHPSLLLSVSDNSKEKSAAAALLNFLVTSPDVAGIFGTSLGVPATEEGRTAAAEASATPADAAILEYASEMAPQTTESYPVLPSGYGTIEAKWAELHQQLQYGEIDTEQFAQALFDEMSLSLGN